MPRRVFLASDERMLLHKPPLIIQEQNSGIVEIPARVERILERLQEKFGDERFKSSINDDKDTSDGTNSLFVNLSCKPASKEVILLAHDEQYYEKVKLTSEMALEEHLNLIEALGEGGDDLYFCSGTFLASSVAVGAVIESAEAVMNARNGITRGIAVVRPPGHHACEQKSMGFCFFNSVAVTAKHCIHQNLASKVVILDWDIHHGNGTQDIVYDDPNIMYISLHRSGSSRMPFYPGTGKPSEVGGEDALGTNINIAWTKKGMGNVEYSAAFAELILPIILDFDPDLILVSCGFDAVDGDYIGDCKLSPSFYGCMTSSLISCLGDKTPLVIALEGGYNVEVNAHCMESIAAVLIDDIPVSPKSALQLQPITMPLSSHNVHEGNSIESSSLERGRAALHGYWPQEVYNGLEKTQLPKIKKIQLSAIKAINKSIKAIKNSPFSMENNSLLYIDEREASSVLTRQRHKASTNLATDSLEEALCQLKL